MSQQTVIIVGALSAIAVATARRLAANGAVLILMARDADELTRHSADLRIRGATVYELALDLAESHPGQVLDGALAAFGPIDLALVCYGSLTDQIRSQNDLAYAEAQLRANFSSTAIWVLAIGRALRGQSAGTMVVLGSVAGDRGRASNYVYGAAKSGLATLVQGLAHELKRSGGARAVIVKPGFVDTPMTAHIPKSGPLWASADQVAGAILRASRGTAPVVYAPSFWRWIMLALRAVPSPLFHRTGL